MDCLTDALVHKDKHAKCKNFSTCSQERPIRLLEEYPGYIHTGKITQPQILILTQGEAEINDNGFRKILHEGYSVLIPPGSGAEIMFTKPSISLLFKIDLHTQSCLQSSLNKMTELQYEAGDTEEYFPLKLNSALEVFVDGLIPFMRAELFCIDYLEAEISKLLHILEGFYHPHEVSRFFLPLLGDDTLFRSMVLANIDSVTTVRQLHELVSPNLPMGRFREKFQQIFRMNPHDYITTYKQKVVYRNVVNTDESLKVIAFENGFNSPQVFIQFCKRHFGVSPGELRKSKRPLSTDEKKNYNYLTI